MRGSEQHQHHQQPRSRRRTTAAPFDPRTFASSGPWAQVCLEAPRDLSLPLPGPSLTRWRLRRCQTGTFARVCLVRPASVPEKDEGSEVYALKILRKAEVIRLKQIDHVRHERQILADVAGHPFITTLVGSFSDHDSLYMLLDYVPGGELFSYLRRHRRFPEEWAQFYAAEIVLSTLR